MLKSIYAFLIVCSSFFMETCTFFIPKEQVVLTYSKKTDISYGKNKANTLDIFYPLQTTKETPLVILIHGGAWCFGQKETLHPVQQFLAKHNIVSANINYRLNKGDITYKEQLEDIDKAITFLKKNCEKLKIPAKRIILFGESAGAHLSLLYGYKNPLAIEKIISLAAPTDLFSQNYLKRTLYHWYTKFFFELTTGVKYHANTLKKFKDASPIANVTRVPTLILQGTNDIVINQSQAFSLDSVLTKKNIPHKLVLIEGGIHISRRIPWLRDKVIYPEMLRFLNKDFNTDNQLFTKHTAP